MNEAIQSTRAEATEPTHHNAAECIPVSDSNPIPVTSSSPTNGGVDPLLVATLAEFFAPGRITALGAYEFEEVTTKEVVLVVLDETGPWLHTHCPQCRFSDARFNFRGQIYRTQVKKAKV